MLALRRERIGAVLLRPFFAGGFFCAGMDFKEFLVRLKDNLAEFDRVERMAREWRGLICLKLSDDGHASRGD